MFATSLSDFPVPFEHAYALFTSDETLLRDGAQRRTYPLASVSKLFSAYGALIAIDGGYLSLDTPAGPDGATIRHLLAHASGLPYESREAQVEVGKRRIYSNAGFEILAEAVATATGTAFNQWVAQTVFEPLGLHDTVFEGSPAHGITSSVADLVTFGQELLAPRLLTPAMYMDAVTPHFAELAGVVPGYGRYRHCLWGLGMEIHGDKDPHWMPRGASPQAFGHFGVTGSFLWIDPIEKIGAAFLGTEPFGPWHKDNWANFNDALIAGR